MVRTLDNITRQAQQGSVAAIIQVLNSELAGLGVRTRAVLSQGILQLLCEADSPSKLNQSTLVQQIQTTLNLVQPRYVRRVRVNTRLVSEQQLLWLDEIERDPSKQLLWTAEFSIQRPRLDQQIRNTLSDWQERNQVSGLVLADTAKRERRKRQIWQLAVGSGGLILFLCLVGWVAYDFLGLGQQRQANTVEQNQDQNTLPIVDANHPSSSTLGNEATANIPGKDANTPPASSPQASTEPQDNLTPDPFAQAVKIAEQSVADGQVAETADDWMEIATRWQRASELMDSVPPNDERYATAQNRTTLYLQNSVNSRKRAEMERQKQDEQSAQPL